MQPTDVETSRAEAAVTLLRAAVDALFAVELVALSEADELELSRGVEREVRRLAGFDHQLVADLDTRNVAFGLGCKNTATLLTMLHRIDPGAARHRVVAARNCAQRVGISGEILPPIFPAVAAAVVDGSIGPAQARIISDTVEALPADVQAEHGDRIERSLVADAQRFEPRLLRLIGRRYVDTYDQDGRLASDDDRERRRFLDLRQRADGTVSGSFQTDAVTGEALLTVLDALGRPLPAEDGTADPRSARQRRHDALRDVLLLALRCDQLPVTAGVTTTIVLLLTPEQLDAAAGMAVGQLDPADAGRTRGPTDGLVPTGHGALMSLRGAATLIGEAQIFPVVLSGLKGIEAYGTSHRLFTQGQRLAMIARDRGCSFPGCTAPPAWCQAHHVVDAACGGPTTVSNGTLVCGPHHRDFARLGYRCVMIGGRPHWIAPTWIDPAQTPVRNHAHCADD